MSDFAGSGVEGVRVKRRHRTRNTAVALIALLVLIVVVSTPSGSVAVLKLRSFLEFYSGVFALVGFTGVVVIGLTASIRGLSIRLRILGQAGHRALSLMSVSFLVAHILLKIMEEHAAVIDAVVPFAHDGFAVGLGVVSSDLVILIIGTGVLRGRFAIHGRPWVWRSLHATAYLMWPLAIWHGLTAGRATLGAWVNWSYYICMALVAFTLMARMPGILRERKRLAPRMARARDEEELSYAASGRGTEDLPDADFWAALRTAAEPWIGGRR